MQCLPSGRQFGASGEFVEFQHHHPQGGNKCALDNGASTRTLVFTVCFLVLCAKNDDVTLIKYRLK